MYLSQRYDSNVYYVRSKCLAADTRKGKNQPPFHGNLNYDYIMWIDSDIIFSTDDFEKLLSHQLDIVAGMYLMEGGQEYAIVKDWDEEEFKREGRFKFLTPADTFGKSEPFEVVYSGFGFMLIKRGVFETVEYPWFAPKFFEIGPCWDFCSEDVGFCLKAREAGFKIVIDPTITVRHEKTCLY